MKPFDLEAAKRGEPVCTRNGFAVKFIAFNGKEEHCGLPQPIEAHVWDNPVNGWRTVCRFSDNGEFMAQTSCMDLFMAEPGDIRHGPDEKVTEQELWWQREDREASGKRAEIADAHAAIRSMLGF